MLPASCYNPLFPSFPIYLLAPAIERVLEWRNGDAREEELSATGKIRFVARVLTTEVALGGLGIVTITALAICSFVSILSLPTMFYTSKPYHFTTSLLLGTWEDLEKISECFVQSLFKSTINTKINRNLSTDFICQSPEHQLQGSKLHDALFGEYMSLANSGSTTISQKLELHNHALLDLLSDYRKLPVALRRPHYSHDELLNIFNPKGDLFQTFLTYKNPIHLKLILLQAAVSGIDVRPFLKCLSPDSRDLLCTLCYGEKFCLNNDPEVAAQYVLEARIMTPSQKLATLIHTLEWESQLEQQEYYDPNYRKLIDAAYSCIDFSTTQAEGINSLSREEIISMINQPYKLGALCSDPAFDICSLYKKIKACEFSQNEEEMHIHKILEEIITTHQAVKLVRALIEDNQQEKILASFKTFFASKMSHAILLMLAILKNNPEDPLIPEIFSWAINQDNQRFLACLCSRTIAPALIASPSSFKILVSCYDESREEVKIFLDRNCDILLFKAMDVCKSSEDQIALLNWINTHKPSLFNSSSDNGNTFLHCLPHRPFRGFNTPDTLNVDNVIKIITWFRENRPDILEILCKPNQAGYTFLFNSRGTCIFRNVTAINNCLISKRLARKLWQVDIYRQPVPERSINHWKDHGCSILRAFSIFNYLSLNDLKEYVEKKLITPQDRIDCIEILKSKFKVNHDKKVDRTDLINSICLLSEDLSKMFSEHILGTEEFKGLTFSLELLFPRAQLICLSKLSVEEVISAVNNIPEEALQAIFDEDVLVERVSDMGQFSEPVRIPLKDALLEFKSQLTSDYEPQLAKQIKERISVFLTSLSPVSLALIAKTEPELILEMSSYLTKEYHKFILPMLSKEDFASFAMNHLITSGTLIDFKNATADQKEHFTNEFDFTRFQNTMSAEFRRIFESEDNVAISDLVMPLCHLSQRLNKLDISLSHISRSGKALARPSEANESPLANKPGNAEKEVRKMLVEMKTHCRKILGELDDLIPKELVDVVVPTALLTDPIALKAPTGHIAWINRSTIELFPREANGHIQHPSTYSPVSTEDASDADPILQEQKREILERVMRHQEELPQLLRELKARVLSEIPN